MAGRGLSSWNLDSAAVTRRTAHPGLVWSAERCGRALAAAFLAAG